MDLGLDRDSITGGDVRGSEARAARGACGGNGSEGARNRVQSELICERIINRFRRGRLCGVLNGAIEDCEQVVWGCHGVGNLQGRTMWVTPWATVSPHLVLGEPRARRRSGSRVAGITRSPRERGPRVVRDPVHGERVPVAPDHEFGQGRLQVEGGRGEPTEAGSREPSLPSRIRSQPAGQPITPALAMSRWTSMDGCPGGAVPTVSRSSGSRAHFLMGVDHENRRDRGCTKTAWVSAMLRWNRTEPRNASRWRRPRPRAGW